MRYEYSKPVRDPYQLHTEIAALGLPGFVGVLTSGDAVFVEFAAALTLAQTSALAAAVLAHTPSAEFARQLLDQDAAAVVGASTPAGKLYRAVVLVSKDEVNALRAWLTDFKGAVAAATSLADLKVRVAALPSMPARTAAQARSALLAKLDEVEAD